MRKRYYSINTSERRRLVRHLVKFYAKAPISRSSVRKDGDKILKKLGTLKTRSILKRLWALNLMFTSDYMFLVRLHVITTLSQTQNPAFQEVKEEAQLILGGRLSYVSKRLKILHAKHAINTDKES